jgi:hypothetical protein
MVTVEVDAADAVLRVEALGGRIFLHSPRGEGTSLRVELPLPATNGGTARWPQAEISLSGNRS